MPFSAAARAAAFKVVDAKLIAFAEAHVPFMFRGTVLDNLRSPEGQAMVKSLIADAFAAAEKAEAAAPLHAR